MRSDERLQRVERWTDLPLFVLALVLIPLLVIPEFADLAHDVEQAFVALDWFIWAVFAVVFAAKLAVAPHPWQYTRSHWLELALVVLPFLRPLRVLSVLRLGRVAVAIGVNVQLIGDLLDQRGTKVIFAAVVAMTVVGATLAFLAEREAPNANIVTYSDALWWAITTMTTVGYGDRFPVTPIGRGLAAALMLFGIGALSALTATIAAYLVREHEDVKLADVVAELRDLRREIERLERGR